MPFRKKHKLGFTSKDPLDRNPICFKVREGVRKKLMAIPDWQKLLREYVDSLTEEKPS
ncbi:MAG: hypothetical protein U7126_09740 [Microcoleus sp.]